MFRKVVLPVTVIGGCVVAGYLYDTSKDGVREYKKTNLQFDQTVRDTSSDVEFISKFWEDALNTLNREWSHRQEQHVTSWGHLDSLTGLKKQTECREFWTYEMANYQEYWTYQYLEHISYWNSYFAITGMNRNARQAEVHAFKTLCNVERDEFWATRDSLRHDRLFNTDKTFLRRKFNEARSQSREDFEKQKIMQRKRTLSANDNTKVVWGDTHRQFSDNLDSILVELENIASSKSQYVHTDLEKRLSLVRSATKVEDADWAGDLTYYSNVNRAILVQQRDTDRASFLINRVSTTDL